VLCCLQVHKRWVQNLEEEFFQQGDAEKRHDLPVSALFDREKPGITKSQVRGCFWLQHVTTMRAPVAQRHAAPMFAHQQTY
jgi:hypothetical protein